jgi:hypothetical protein
MRKFIVLSAAMLCFAGAAAAQSDTTVNVVAEPAPAAASNMHTSNDYPWQVGANFAYQRFDIGGSNSNLYGVQTSVARWLGDSMFGIEGDVTATFGRFNPHIREQQVFYGGGVHIGARSGKLQPWGHVIAGGAHERFNQGVGPSGFNGFGIMAGGGADIQWRSHVAFRFQADFLTTHYNGFWQKSISTGAGVLFDF